MASSIYIWTKMGLDNIVGTSLKIPLIIASPIFPYTHLCLPYFIHTLDLFSSNVYKEVSETFA